MKFRAALQKLLSGDYIFSVKTQKPLPPCFHRMRKWQLCKLKVSFLKCPADKKGCSKSNDRVELGEYSKNQCVTEYVVS